MKKEAIKNKKHLSLSQLCTMSSGLLLCCVLRPPVWAQTGPNCSIYRDVPTVTVAAAAATICPTREPWVNPLYATPSWPALAPKHWKWR